MDAIISDTEAVRDLLGPWRWSRSCASHSSLPITATHLQPSFNLLLKYPSSNGTDTTSRMRSILAMVSLEQMLIHSSKARLLNLLRRGVFIEVSLTSPVRFWDGRIRVRTLWMLKLEGIGE